MTSCCDRELRSFTALNIPPIMLSPNGPKICMHFRIGIFFGSVALFASAVLGQSTTQPTVDELVAKNIEAKGGATALHDLQSLRLTGKLLVDVGGQIELAYLTSQKAAR